MTPSVFDLKAYGMMLDAIENLGEAADALAALPVDPTFEPIDRRCPFCSGTGGGQWNDCPACDGNGVI
jgi:hypothetical protein